jgi:hypothetical protein
LPPVRLVAFLAQKREHADGALPARSAPAAELPKLARGALVAVDQVIELEGVDLPCVQPRKAVATRSSSASSCCSWYAPMASRASRRRARSSPRPLCSGLTSRTVPLWAFAALRSSSPQSWVGAADLTALLAGGFAGVKRAATAAREARPEVELYAGEGPGYGPRRRPAPASTDAPTRSSGSSHVPFVLGGPPSRRPAQSSRRERAGNGQTSFTTSDTTSEIDLIGDHQKEAIRTGGSIGLAARSSVRTAPAFHSCKRLRTAAIRGE